MTDPNDRPSSLADTYARLVRKRHKIDSHIEPLLPKLTALERLALDGGDDVSDLNRPPTHVGRHPRFDPPDMRPLKASQETAENTRTMAQALLAVVAAQDAERAHSQKTLFWTRVAGVAAVLGIAVTIALPLVLR